MGELLTFPLELPADLAADVRGPPPARAWLATLVAWRRRVADAGASLEVGRRRIAAQIDAAEGLGQGQGGRGRRRSRVHRGSDQARP